MRYLLIAAVLAGACAKKQEAPARVEVAPEQWDETAGRYVAAGGTATLQLPSLGPGWQVVRQRNGEVGVLTLFLGTMQSWQGYVSFLFYPRAAAAVNPRVVAERQVTELRAATPFLEPAGTPESFLLPGGAGFSLQLTGKNTKGVQEVLNVLAVADGTAAVGVIFRGTPADMNGGRLEQIASALLGGLRVGAKQ